MGVFLGSAIAEHVSDIVFVILPGTLIRRRKILAYFFSECSREPIRALGNLKITDRVSSLVWILDDERAAGEHVLPRDLVPVLVLRVVKFPEESRAQWHVLGSAILCSDREVQGRDQSASTRAKTAELG